MAEKLQRLWARFGIPADYCRARKMPLQREAKRLVLAGHAPDNGKPVRLTPRAAAAWRRMRVQAARDGVTLLPLSGYRSIAKQTRIIRANLAKGRPLDDLLRYIAAPGCSEHHTGRALDIGSPQNRKHFEEDFVRTPEFRWLKRNAGRFGFRLSYPRRNPHRIGYEPWHWLYNR